MSAAWLTEAVRPASRVRAPIRVNGRSLGVIDVFIRFGWVVGVRINNAGYLPDTDGRNSRALRFGACNDYKTHVGGVMWHEMATWKARAGKPEWVIYFQP